MSKGFAGLETPPLFELVELVGGQDDAVHHGEGADRLRRLLRLQLLALGQFLHENPQEKNSVRS